MADLASQVLFVHIPKTAGTSVRSMISTRLERSEMLEVSEGRAQWDVLVSRVDAHRFVDGHVGYGFASAFRCPPTVVAFLREPIERAVSAYCYLRESEAFATAGQSPAWRSSRERAERRARQFSLLEFIQSEPLTAAAHLGNVQTWYLGSETIRRRPYADVGVDDLERAKKHLTQCGVVGLTERFDDSMTMLCRALGWPSFPNAHHANASRDRAAAELDPATIAAIGGLTELDRELYGFAAALWEERWHALVADRAAGADPAPSHAPAPVTAGPSGGCAFVFDSTVPGDGWYGPEPMGDRLVSWSGPGRESWVALAPAARADMILRARVAHAMTPQLLTGTQLLVGGVALATRVAAEEGDHVLTARVPAGLLDHSGAGVRVGLRVPDVLRPCDLDPRNRDSRWLGVAVASITLAPV